MICQNCGSEIGKNATCPHCGSDVHLMNLARDASLRQYNKGVTAAREGDYSGAIEALNRCILFDKRNVVARNLLGIAYYQVGMPGNALEQWIISSSLQGENNPAAGYIASLQRHARTLEKQDDAVVMYHKALELFQSGSDDLAVIQLKKAVDFSPNFVRAHNLLAAYYLSKKEKSKARLHINKALRVDKANPKALEYLAILTSGGAEKNNKSKTGYDESAAKKDFSRVIRPELVTFVLGVVVTAIATFFLALPAVTQVQNDTIRNLEQQVATLTEENENGTSKFALEYQALEEENAQLKTENEAYRQSEANRQQAADLQLAQAYAVSDQQAEAAKLLHDLDVTKFSQEDQDLIAQLKEQTYTFAAAAYYESGNEKFSAGDTAGAEADLLLALDYGQKEDFMDNVLYLLGQIYEEKGDYAQAKEYYGRVVNEFADSDVFGQAEERMNAIMSL